MIDHKAKVIFESLLQFDRILLLYHKLYCVIRNNIKV